MFLAVTEGQTLSTVVMTNPWVRYEFYVTARNAIGQSDRAGHSDDGTPAVCVTPSTAPRRNPAGVCTRLGQPHQLVIVWQVCTVDCFCFYRIQLSIVDSIFSLFVC